MKPLQFREENTGIKVQSLLCFGEDILDLFEVNIMLQQYIGRWGGGGASPPKR